MKPEQIQVGKTYRNKTGRSVRKVLHIEEWYIKYDQIKGPWEGFKGSGSLSRFARWAHSEVETKGKNETNP